MESPLSWGLALAAYGADRARQEMGGGMLANTQTPPPQPVPLSKTPQEEVLNKALDIRRRLLERGGG